ncbi:MAG TPA: hypothetical protein QF533_00200 [Nitrospinota bacterium]|nr:hypothetical protein [Nitrospinota bacterium]
MRSAVKRAASYPILTISRCGHAKAKALTAKAPMQKAALETGISNFHRSLERTRPFGPNPLAI